MICHVCWTDKDVKEFPTIKTSKVNSSGELKHYESHGLRCMKCIYLKAKRKQFKLITKLP